MYLATTGETITAIQHNSPIADLAADANAARPVIAGGTGKTTLGSDKVLVGNGSSAVKDDKAAPAGAFVGTTDTQTLTNKTLTSPTINTPTFSAGAVDTADLADDAVTEGKLADDAVATAKIADDAVTLAKQAAGTANRLQGYDASGDPTEVTVSSGLSLSAGVLTGSPPVDYQAFTASGTWTKPSGTSADSRVFVQIWGAGGGGYNSGASASGGGGGAYAEVWWLASQLGSTESVTVGTGAVAANGGSSSFNGVTANGGGAASVSAAGAGGTSVSDHWAGGKGAAAGVSNGVSVAMGGGGGGAQTGEARGTSIAGGNGGIFQNAGSAPGGGGSGYAAGARGEVRVTTFL